MKLYPRILALVMASSCLLLGTALTANAGVTNQAAKTVKNNKAVSLLFVITSKQGKLTHISGSRYQLVMPVKDIKSVLAFSDRPNRIAFRMKPTHYAKMVFSGADSFRKNPPNIVISWDNNRIAPMVYEIVGHKKSKYKLTFQLNKLGANAKTSQADSTTTGGLVLFIDGTDGTMIPTRTAAEADEEIAAYDATVEAAEEPTEAEAAATEASDMRHL